ncbi:MAG TPA: FAD-dependent oxidoreductase [bacterium]|nr:FAD-dependent oxidoreductase [bacterium]HPN35719.1 FAD-dependent oxidoreductase [bacterium]
MKKWIILTVGLTTFASASSRQPEVIADYDVVIYGATSAGVTAAIQVQAMGRTAVILEPGQHVGGMTSGGLGSTDTGSKAVVGGLSRKFYQRIKKYYDDPQVWRYESQADYARYRPQDDAMWTFEPHVAERILRHMLEQSGARVFFGERLERKNGVRMKKGRIRSIRMESGKRFTAAMFIDAGYEGDLMAAAGVSYTVGREANAQYGETLNGVQTAQAQYHQFIFPVDPYVRPGDASSGLLHGVDDSGPGLEGSADRRVQAYNFRLCVTDVTENQIPFTKPEGYDESRYELLLRTHEAGDTRVPLSIIMMPNRKTDINNNFAVSTDYIGQNYDYPDGDYGVREKIRRAHVSYIQGLLWTLANHPRMPQAIRDQVKKWGWTKDEFLDTGHFPNQLYVREARRMVGDFVTTELTCRRLQPTPEPVGMGSYNMDSHHVQRYITAEGFVRNEGDVQVHPGGPYPISYRSLVPKKGQCKNLLVPVCLSASHIAYGTVRMEPVFMILGQSAATAAVRALEQKQAVQEVSYDWLRERLLQDGQILEYRSQ